MRYFFILSIAFLFACEKTDVTPATPNTVDKTKAADTTTFDVVYNYNESYRYYLNGNLVNSDPFNAAFSDSTVQVIVNASGNYLTITLFKDSLGVYKPDASLKMKTNCAGGACDLTTFNDLDFKVDVELAGLSYKGKFWGTMKAVEETIYIASGSFLF